MLLLLQFYYSFTKILKWVDFWLNLQELLDLPLHFPDQALSFKINSLLKGKSEVSLINNN